MAKARTLYDLAEIEKGLGTASTSPDFRKALGKCAPDLATRCNNKLTQDEVDCIAQTLEICPQTDWELIIKADISLLWCEFSMRFENHDKCLGQVLCEFARQYAGTYPLNVGTLLMASYILFVYPQQTAFEAIDLAKIDTSGFKVHYGTPARDKRRFCSRIRNSLSHGRFWVEVEKKQIRFRDHRVVKGFNDADEFAATISITDLGEFINRFMLEVKQQCVA